jgi:hypothetical protein
MMKNCFLLASQVPYKKFSIRVIRGSTFYAAHIFRG